MYNQTKSIKSNKTITLTTVPSLSTLQQVHTHFFWEKTEVVQCWTINNETDDKTLKKTELLGFTWLLYTTHKNQKLQYSIDETNRCW